MWIRGWGAPGAARTGGCHSRVGGGGLKWGGLGISGLEHGAASFLGPLRGSVSSSALWRLGGSSRPKSDRVIPLLQPFLRPSGCRSRPFTGWSPLSFQTCFSSPADRWIAPEYSFVCSDLRAFAQGGPSACGAFPTWPVHPHSLSPSSSIHSSMKSFLSPAPRPETLRCSMCHAYKRNFSKHLLRLEP